jgi:hypothetical protein
MVCRWPLPEEVLYVTEQQAVKGLLTLLARQVV